MSKSDNKSTTIVVHAAELFAKLSEQEQQNIIDLIISLLSER